MQSIYFATALMLLGGALLSIQAPLNALLGSAVGSPVNAALISFLVGTAALTVITIAQRAAPDSPAMHSLPWYAWVGGLCGAVFVSASAYAAPRIGVATMLTLAVASQLVMAVALDHFGAFGIRPHTASAGRVVGLVLVVIGAIMVRKF
jgi:bacterial/archaeal transporter family-2 protein